MRKRPLLPELLLAAGIMGATALSLPSARSWAWAMVGPVALAATIVGVSALRRGGRVQAPDFILAAAVILGGVIVAAADLGAVPIIMPILGASAAVGAFRREDRECSRSSWA
ncbi:MAG: hypothetical protein JOZ54_20605 [Acidobacteria bacterium]|nr:hypothetical protein [Acidobacteriota bacterium]